MKHPDTVGFTLDADHYLDFGFVVRDAMNATDCPSDLEHAEREAMHVVEGSPLAVRWLYDWCCEAQDNYKDDMATQEAQAADHVASKAWNALPDEKPSRQRKRRMADGGVDGQ